MIFSKHNIFSRIKDSENYFIVNLLSGNADIVYPKEAGELKDFISGKNLSPEFSAGLEAKGYVVDEKEEERLYRSKYLDFIDTRDDDEVQSFLCAQLQLQLFLYLLLSGCVFECRKTTDP